MKDRWLSYRLSRIFECSTETTGHTLPLRRTAKGIWVPTPISVIRNAAQILNSIGILNKSSTENSVIDAGCGDGRLLGSLAALIKQGCFYGIELDPTLYAKAEANIKSLSRKHLTGRATIGLIRGNYCRPDTYRVKNDPLTLQQKLLFLNYPDGNERKLARFINNHCRTGTTLCLLSPDRKRTIHFLAP